MYACMFCLSIKNAALSILFILILRERINYYQNNPEKVINILDSRHEMDMTLIVRVRQKKLLTTQIFMEFNLNIAATISQHTIP